jgi:hypothetical protein
MIKAFVKQFHLFAGSVLLFLNIPGLCLQKEEEYNHLKKVSLKRLFSGKIFEA